MNRCTASCDIETKLFFCCRNHPITEEKVILTLSTGRKVEACPHLTSQGLCEIYDNGRPQICKSHYCG